MQRKFLLTIITTLSIIPYSNSNNLIFLNDAKNTYNSDINLKGKDTFQCHSVADCSSNGTCVNLKCECYDGYSGEKCEFELKSQLKAFLFEMIIGFGAGHWYTKRYLFASFKLCSFIFALYLIFFYPKLITRYFQDEDSGCFFTFSVTCFYCLISCGIVFWYVYDIVQFGLNNYNDGNDQPLIRTF